MLEYLRETMDLPMVDIRTHRTPLYNSIYRFGDSLLVNTHSYGAYASKSPVQHLQKVPGGRLFAYYMGFVRGCLEDRPHRNLTSWDGESTTIRTPMHRPRTVSGRAQPHSSEVAGKSC